MTCVDYQKAFNRQDPNNFLVILHRMGVAGWLLKIVCGFPEGRVMFLTHDGATSARKDMPGVDLQAQHLGS